MTTTVSLSSKNSKNSLRNFNWQKLLKGIMDGLHKANYLHSDNKGQQSTGGYNKKMKWKCSLGSLKPRKGFPVRGQRDTQLWCRQDGNTIRPQFHTTEKTQCPSWGLRYMLNKLREMKSEKNEEEKMEMIAGGK